MLEEFEECRPHVAQQEVWGMIQTADEYRIFMHVNPPNPTVTAGVLRALICLLQLENNSVKLW